MLAFKGAKPPVARVPKVMHKRVEKAKAGQHEHGCFHDSEDQVNTPKEFCRVADTG